MKAWKKTLSLVGDSYETKLEAKKTPRKIRTLEKKIDDRNP